MSSGWYFDGIETQVQMDIQDFPVANNGKQSPFLSYLSS